MRLALLVLAVGCGAGSASSAAGADCELPLDRLRFPPGSEISVWARVEDARSLTLGSEGTVFVGNRRGDSVWALRDTDGDGRAESRWRLASSLDMPNGVAFRDGALFVAEVGRILIAEHGSWNRSEKIGYRVMVARLKGSRVTEVKPFIKGWLQGERAWGRPVDVLVVPDGSLLVSDDHAGAIYRVIYRPS
jgi:glucose/arabinose dehydrogenase